MDFQTLLIFILGASTAGLLSGFIGLGGMSIFMPMLFWYVYHVNFNLHEVPLLVWIIANALPVMGINSAVSVYQYKKDNINIDYKIFKHAMPFAAMFACLGLILAVYSNQIGIADKWFGAYLVLIGLYNVFLHLKPAKEKEPSIDSIALSGTFGGFIAGFIGFNGNSIFIPLLRYIGFCSKSATATAQAIGVVVATVLSLLIYAYTSLYGIKIFDWFVIIGLTIPSTIFSIIGAKLKNKCNSKTINNMQAMAYIVFGINLLCGLSHSLFVNNKKDINVENDKVVTVSNENIVKDFNINWYGKNEICQTMLLNWHNSENKVVKKSIKNEFCNC